MLQLSEVQWQEILSRDARNFATAVCDQFLISHPEMRDSPGRSVVQARMQAAQDYCIKTGFTSTPHVLSLMYLAADAPGIHDDTLIDNYLRKPGATPEQRLDDMLIVLDRRLERTN